ncbi:MAG: response regulator [Sphingomonadales bacterium]
MVDGPGHVRLVSDQIKSWLGLEDVAHVKLLGDVLAAPSGTTARLDSAGQAIGEFDVKAQPLATGAGAPAAASESAAGTIYLVRQKTQASLRAAPRDDVAQAVFNDAPVGMAVIDSRGDFLRVNKVLRRLLGAGEKASFDYLYAAFSAEKAAHIKSNVASVCDGKAAPDGIEAKIAHTEDAVIHLSGQSLDQPTGEILIFVSDATEQKSLEQQFAQAQKMQAVGQLAGGIAHDFNNILTAIIGFCDLLLVRHNAGDPSFADIMQIKQNANRAANLVRQLLAFSRQQTLMPKVLDITDVLAELSNLIRRLIGEKITLNMVHGRDLGPILVDQGQLEQVIVNLAVNARDAMDSSGDLTITTAMATADDIEKLGHEFMPNQDYIRLEVSDTGHGIDQANLNKIFEPFFTTKETGKGTGLGLSTVYGIVKQTGGFIFAESEPGAGAKFIIYLPVHVPAEDAQTVEEDSSKAPEVPQVADYWGRGTVMLVEDEDAVRTFASRALSKKGYHVIVASSGQEALELLEDGLAIDLLITDVVMPQMDGPELVQEVRQKRPDLHVIFISGYAQDGIGSAGDLDRIDFLPKPFSLTQLAEAVKTAMPAAPAEDI